jgi:hypothetical protein
LLAIISLLSVEDAIEKLAHHTKKRCFYPSRNLLANVAISMASRNKASPPSITPTIASGSPNAKVVEKKPLPRKLLALRISDSTHVRDIDEKC